MTSWIQRLRYERYDCVDAGGRRWQPSSGLRHVGRSAICLYPLMYHQRIDAAAKAWSGSCSCGSLHPGFSRHTGTECNLDIRVSRWRCLGESFRSSPGPLCAGRWCCFEIDRAKGGWSWGCRLAYSMVSVLVILHSRLTILTSSAQILWSHVHDPSPGHTSCWRQESLCVDAQCLRGHRSHRTARHTSHHLHGWPQNRYSGRENYPEERSPCWRISVCVAQF